VKSLLNWFKYRLCMRTQPGYEQIISALSPWTLACAVGVTNGSIYGKEKGLLTFELWWRLLDKKGVTISGVPLDVVRATLQRYAERNANKHMNDILSAEMESRHSLYQQSSPAPEEEK